MAITDRRELQPAAEYGGAETEVTYQDNVAFSYGGTGIDLAVTDGLATAAASEGFDSDGAGLADCITVKMHVRDMNVNLAERTPLRAYMSTDPAGASAVNAVTTGPITVEAGMQVAQHTALADFLYLTDANGVLTLEIVNTATESLYLVVAYKGRLFVSSILTWL